MSFQILLAFSRPKRQRLLRYAVIISITLFFITTFLDKTLGASRARIQHDGFKKSKTNTAQSERQRLVKKEFLHAWYGYKDHAWLGDTLMSLSGSKKEQFCGWSATLIDTLDTLWIMDLKEEFDEAVEAAVAIDFVNTAKDCSVNLFESTIRYLGGVLAAYDLSGDRRLYPKLVELGELLYGQFRTTNGMPCNHCKLIKDSDSPPSPAYSVPLADVGSFTLEFARLSQVTGDRKYLELVGFLTNVFESTQNTSSIPGLWPETVSAFSIDGPSPGFATQSSVYSIGALADSAYEYLVKAHLLIGGLTSSYASMWNMAAQAIQQNLLFRAYIPQHNNTVLFTGSATHYRESADLLLEPRIQHLGCFAGGMFAMSGRMFDRPFDLDIGKQLTEGCIWAYENAPSGIMPETVTLLSCPDMVGAQCEWNQTVWDEALKDTVTNDRRISQINMNYPPGYLYAIDARYLLRPEAIESVFILYRITGDEYYREAGWRMFKNIIAQTRTPYGHASLSNVLKTEERQVWEHGELVMRQKVVQDDEMESFWLAETLKYFYLLFSEPDRISLDEWVLNTEAHPLRLTKGLRGF